MEAGHLCQPRSCPPAGQSSPCVPAQALLCSNSMGGALPALLLAASLVLVPFGQNGVGAGQPLVDVVPSTQVQGAGSFCPWGCVSALVSAGRLAEQKAWGLEHKEYPHLKSFPAHEQHPVTKHRARKSLAYVSRTNV